MLNSFVKYQNYWLWGVVLATLTLSLGYSFHFRIEPIVDARAYDGIAWDIAQGNGYDRDSAVGRPGPGYEYFLALIYYIFGHSYAAVWVIQAILLAATACLVFLISRLALGELWHPVAGLASAALVGWSVDLITVSAMLMTEIFFLFLLVLAVYLFFKYVNDKKIVWLPLAAVVLAGAVLTRSNVLFLIFPIAGYFIYRRDWRSGALFAAVFLLAMTPWTIRNYQIYGEFMPFNVSFGLLYVGNHPGATGELVLNYPLPEGYGDFSQMSQIENDKALRRAGRDYILRHPFDFLKLTFYRLSIYFSSARPFAFWPHLTGFSKLATIFTSALYSFVIFGFGLLGAILAGRRSWLLFSMFLMMPLSIVALIVETRYRFAAYPFMAVFAGLAVYYIFAKRQEFWAQLKKIAATLTLLVGNTIFDVIRNLDRIMERL